MEVRLALGNGESLLLVLGIPVLLLVFFSTVDVLPTEDVAEDPVDFLVPGIVSLGVISSAFAQLAISTGFDRQYGVLKRLGTTPLRRGELLTAKVAVVLIIQAIQFIVIIALGTALGWPPDGVEVVEATSLSVSAALVATVALAACGFLLAGRLRGLVVLATANAVYLVLLLVSGVVIPLEELAGPLRSVVRLLPSTALAEIVHGAMRSGTAVPGRAWLVLAAWAVVASAAAVRWFRWSPD